MSIGNHNEYIGRIKYQSDGLLDNPLVMGLLIGGSFLGLVIVLAVIIGCVVKKKRYPVKKPDSQSNTEGVTMVSRYQGVDYLTPGAADQGDDYLSNVDSDAYPSEPNSASNNHLNSN